MHDDTTRTGDTRQPDDWTGDDWARDEVRRLGGSPTGAPGSPAETAATTDAWNKAQVPGDQGHGPMAGIDPDAMPEGDSDLSGFRHGSGESHFAEGQAEGTADAPVGGPADAPRTIDDEPQRDREPDFNPDIA